MQKRVEYIEYLIKWLQEEVKKSNKKGVIVGVSGGVDSALVAILAKKAFGEKATFVALPIEKMTQDLEDAKLLAKTMDFKLEIFDLTKTFRSFEQLFDFQNHLARMNIKPRIRMTFLYALAQERELLVLGTDNLAEFYLGYFTKFGDGACDLLPIARLTKKDVWEFASFLKVPSSIINKAPSAALFSNQKDEEELGFSYLDFENFFQEKEVNQEIKEKIKNQILLTNHKRIFPKKPKPFYSKELDFFAKFT